MPDQSPPASRTPAGVWTGRDAVLTAALLLIALQLAVRATASQQGWFYSDDFELLSDATGRGLSRTYLFTPHDLHLMPGGLFMTWLVAQAGAFNWALASGMLVALQALADVACLAMLLRAFGRRWAVVALLSLYLFSSLTLTAFMWWSAAINQVPAQAAFFVAVTCHLTHLRTGRTRPALLAALAVAVGLLFFEKALLVLGPIFALTLVWPGVPGRGVLDRARANLGRSWRALATYGVLAAGYLALYAASPRGADSTSPGEIDWDGLTDAMLRRSLATSLLGGPWRWSDDNPPLGQVAAPDWVATLCLVAIAAVVVLAVQRGSGDWRALVLVVPYLAVSVLLTGLGRGAQLGSFAGLELRYLADAAPVLTLGAGMLFLRLRTDPSPEAGDATEPVPLGSATRTRVAMVGLVSAAAVAGSVVTHVGYLRSWTGDFPAKSYTRTVVEASRAGTLRVVDSPVPELVMSATSFPSNLPSRMFAPLGDRVQAATSGTDLQALGTTGTPYAAVVTGGAESVPGPVEGCGYPVTSSTTKVLLDGTPPDFFWWAEISYLSGSPGRASVQIGDTVHEWPVERGVHRYFLQGEGSVEDVRVRQLEGADAICVDAIAIGQVSAVEPLG